MVISSPSSRVLQLISTSKVNDQSYMDLFNRISVNPNSKTRYAVKRGFLMFDDRLYIPNEPGLQRLLFAEAHNTSTGRPLRS